eukprot:1122372_1
MYAFGAKEWLSECLHVFDFLIVVITFSLELLMHGNDKVQSMIGLLVVFRLWRLVRVIHVTTEALDLQHETELEELKEQIEDLEQELEALDLQHETELEELKEQIEDLEQELEALRKNNEEKQKLIN